MSLNTKIRYEIPNNFSGFYVDTVNGNDLNDGLTSSTAFKHIQACIDYIYKDIDCSGYQIVINIVPGSIITECICLFGQATGARPQIIIKGEFCVTGIKTSWNLQSNYQTAIQVRDNGILTIEGFVFNAGSYTGCCFLNPSQQGVLDYSKIDFGSCLNGYHIFIDHGGSCNCLDNSTGTNITGSASSHILLGGIGASHSMGGATINISAGLSFYNFIQAAGNCMLNWGFNYFSGSTITGNKYSITLNAIFIKNGTVIPGSGTTVNTGGQVL